MTETEQKAAQHKDIDEGHTAKMVSIKISAVKRTDQAHIEPPAQTYRIPGAVLTVGAEPIAMEVTEQEAEHMKLDKFLHVEVVGPANVHKHDSERHPVMSEAASNMPHVAPKPGDKGQHQAPPHPQTQHPTPQPPAQEPLEDQPSKGGHKR